MAKRDCYDVLGVSKSSSKDEIKKAFQIFLKIFLEILVILVNHQEGLAIEEMI